MIRKRKNVRPCTGTNKRGEPCAHVAMAGVDVCFLHGGEEVTVAAELAGAILDEKQVVEPVRIQQCAGVAYDGSGQCEWSAIPGTEFCIGHTNVFHDFTLAYPDLPEELEAALHRITADHWRLFVDCHAGALVPEKCGHGGTNFVCWGCRSVIATTSHMDDPCLEDFRVRAVDPDTETPVAAAVLAPPVEQPVTLLPNTATAGV